MSRELYCCYRLPVEARRVPDVLVTGDLITGMLSGPGAVKVSVILDDVKDSLQPTNKYCRWWEN